MSRPETMDNIMALVVRASRWMWGQNAITESDIIGTVRGVRVAACRAVFVGLCRRRTAHSLPEVARRMNREGITGAVSSSLGFNAAMRGDTATACDELIVEIMAVVERIERGETGGDG